MANFSSHFCLTGQAVEQRLSRDKGETGSGSFKCIANVSANSGGLLFCRRLSPAALVLLELQSPAAPECLRFAVYGPASCAPDVGRGGGTTAESWLLQQVSQRSGKEKQMSRGELLPLC